MFDEFTSPFTLKPPNQTFSLSIIDNIIHPLPSPIVQPLYNDSYSHQPSHHPVESLTIAFITSLLYVPTLKPNSLSPPTHNFI